MLPTSHPAPSSASVSAPSASSVAPPPVGGAAAVLSSTSSPSSGGDFSPSDALLVEVQGENGAYYKARVRDVFPEAPGEVLLSFERDWQPQSRFPLGRVRLPPPANAPGHVTHYTEGQEIEVYSRASDQVRGHEFWAKLSQNLEDYVD